MDLSGTFDEKQRKMTRDDFMNFFRNDEVLATLSTDDRIEVFLQILPGASYSTLELIAEFRRDD